MFCERAMELVRELHRAAEGRLPAFNVRAAGGRAPPRGGFSGGCAAGTGRRVCPWFSAVDVAGLVSAASRVWAGRSTSRPGDALERPGDGCWNAGVSCTGEVWTGVAGR